ETIATGIARECNIKIAFSNKSAKVEDTLLVYRKGVIEELDLPNAVSFAQMPDVLEHVLGRSRPQHRHRGVAEGALSRTPARHDNVGRRQIPVGRSRRKVSVDVD